MSFCSSSFQEGSDLEICGCCLDESLVPDTESWEGTGQTPVGTAQSQHLNCGEKEAKETGLCWGGGGGRREDSAVLLWEMFSALLKEALAEESFSPESHYLKS